MRVQIINKSQHQIPNYETTGAAGMDIRANIDRKNGSISIAQFIEVVENVDNESTQMTFIESQRRNLNLLQQL